MKRPNNTALYMRLSVDDENYGDSVSIETQRTILQAFAKENGFNVYDEYVDDGWSGTNFDRPAFRRMMADADAGRINCIVTKDLSRFGREHVMMDYYLEFVFPEKRLRYIAVTDNEDTDRGLSDFVPFKNLFNEWFAKDTSRKVKAAFRAKYASGEHVCTYAPLGYRKDPDHPNKLIIDEENRWIIERIFELASHGVGANGITRILTEEKVPTPSWIHYRRDGSFANVHGENPGEKAYQWTNAYVKGILTNETYIGHSVQYKQHSISYKNKKRINSRPEERVRVENTHEAIIEKKLFEQVQKQLARRRRSTGDNSLQMFAGLINCGGCGRSLSYGRRNSGGRSLDYFNCAAYRVYGAGRSGCTQHYIRYETLYAFVLARIQTWSKLAQTDEKQLLQRILNADDRERTASAKKQASELARAEKRRDELDRLFSRLYEDWVSGRITEYNFNMLSEKYQAEQTELAEKAECLQAELCGEQKAEDNAAKWISLIRRYANPTELDAEMLNTLIEKIVVHEAFKAPDGSREQEIEICYRFAGRDDKCGELVSLFQCDRAGV